MNISGKQSVKAHHSLHYRLLPIDGDVYLQSNPAQSLQYVYLVARRHFSKWLRLFCGTLLVP